MDERLSDLSELSRRPVEAWRRGGWWGRKPLWERVHDVARVNPNKPAILEYDRETTYRDLWGATCRQSAAIKAVGAEARDIILVQLPNWTEFVAIAVAAELARVVFSFCPIQWDKRETLRALRLIRPRIWFTTASPRPGEDRSDMLQAILAELGTQAPQLVLSRSAHVNGTLSDSEWIGSVDEKQIIAMDGGRGQEPLEIAVTSGSTGDPKGVLHIHDSALATIDFDD